MAKIIGNTTTTPMLVDQEYNPESKKPQSGKAVAQALENIQPPEQDLSNYYTKEESDVRYPHIVFLDEMLEAVDAHKADRQKRVLITNGYTINIEDNTLYYAETDISNLTLVYPTKGNFICELDFKIANEGDVTITLPQSKYIGGTPTFANGETWELNIKNGVVVGGLVE